MCVCVFVVMQTMVRTHRSGIWDYPPLSSPHVLLKPPTGFGGGDREGAHA